jgi:hypothetical protein
MKDGLSEIAFGLSKTAAENHYVLATAGTLQKEEVLDEQR